ncbi:unnamed protein product [Rotaria sp. Silwood1]|nr:unnamed protein product [Rotaria sp. Silwood1]CAF1303563.1 unnamed protein product [Rotaria sp. Silwood1]CAF3494957.1 unnamed protein product [Rotaria sp. Silwood1]CAF3529104.1 unnamed protein product [Rotaria sp. Silwood1]CAF4569248.1 unnamed protein product [Rotaria sp. Silwood1]
MNEENTDSNSSTTIDDNEIPEKFKLDRNKIQTATLIDENDEINQLGLSVFNQADLEQGLIDQVDNVVSNQERHHKSVHIEKQIQSLEQTNNSLRSSISSKQQILSTIDKATYLASRKDIQKANIEKTIKELKQQLTKNIAKIKSLKIELIGFSPIDNENENNQIKQSTTSTSLIDTLMPTQHNYDENGLLKSTIDQNERLTSFDSFMQSLDHEYDKRKQLKNKIIEKKPSEVQKTTTTDSSAFPSTPLTLDGPIEYRDKKVKKKPSPIKKTKTKAKKATTTKKPLVISSSSSDDDNEETDPSKMVYDEDNAWFESDEDEKQRLVDEDEDFYEPKKKKKRSSAKDDGDDQQYLTRLRDFYADQKPPSHTNNNENDDIEIGKGFWIPSSIWNRLFNYQRAGVKWLWELYEQKCGGIIADEMGLGKTIQIIAYLAAFHYSRVRDTQNRYRGLGPVLIVCPSTLLHQWVHEFHEWWPEFRVAVLHESGSFQGKKGHRLIHKIGTTAAGILITSYANILIHYDTLVSYPWHYFILDEGHKIRNPDAQITTACKSFRTPHRLILSGSPMQNNLRELWSLFDFVFPGKLGTLPTFMEYFAIPITRGGYANANPIEVQTAYKCACILRDTIKKYLIRRIKSEQNIVLQLPMKNEQVLFCRLTKTQKYIYKEYLKSQQCKDILKGSLQVFVGLINLRKICNHPDLFTDWSQYCPEYGENPNEVNQYGYTKRSGKMIVLETLLKIWYKQNNRCLLFTQSKQMLNILEVFLTKHNYSYLKMDGTTSIASRQGLVTQFNSDSSIFVFLLTTRVGGLGINLTGANRVLIFDPDWNPSTDIQARERAWRIGQTKNVTIYRLLTSGTIEEKIYHRQIFKQFLTNRVLQDPKQRRFFKSNDLHELFHYDDDNDSDDERTETSILLAGTNSEINLKEKYDKRKRNKNAKFEGQRVPNLTKIDSKISTNQQDIQNDIDKEKDDYVLSKLFKKSVVHSALQHDSIVDHSINDYVFIETEAHRYAEEAVKALRKSAQDCYSAESGIPNWGARNIQHIRRFGSRTNKDVIIPDDDQPSSSSIIKKSNTRISNSSSNLLKDIRERKREQSDFIVHTNGQPIEHDDEENSSNDEGLTLIRELKDYLQIGTSIRGKATTGEIIDYFQKRLDGKPGLIPKFKSLLKQIANLERTPSGIGFWVLKEEFRET